jgi:hypothetical protein
MEGMSDKSAKELIPLAKSWLKPAKLEVKSGCTSRGYDRSQRAYILEAKDTKLSFSIAASERSPIVNPCFVIKNWNRKDVARLELNGARIKQGKALRQGIVYDTGGTRTLVVWAKIASTEPMRVSIN